MAGHAGMRSRLRGVAGVAGVAMCAVVLCCSGAAVLSRSRGIEDLAYIPGG